MRVFVLGEFKTPGALLGAGAALRKHGYDKLDSHSPYPLAGLEEALGISPSRLPVVVLCGGLFGMVGGYLIQWWINTVSFRINVGNRAPHAAPSFIPITFECAILLAAVSAFVGLLLFVGLPRLYHPIFDAEAFRSAAVDRFWLSVEVPPDREAERQAMARLQALGAEGVTVVEEAR